jgi:hypothetical protein
MFVYVRLLQAENNVRPLFPVVVLVDVTHELLQTAYVPYTP